MSRYRWLGFDEPRILAAQMKLIDDSYAAGAAGCFGGALLMAATLRHGGAGEGVLVWVGLMGLVCLVGPLGRHWLPDRLGESGSQRYALLMTLMLSLAGGLWGAVAPLWLDLGSLSGTVEVLGMLAGMNAAALGLFCPCRPVATAFSLASVAPTWMVFVFDGDPRADAMIIAAPLFLIMMMIFIARNASNIRRSVALNFENLDLLNQVRQQMEEVLRAQQQAEEANRAKSVILASASHDLRQPLHALGLFLATLGRTPLQPAQQELLGHAQASALSAQEMLDTLLDFSRLDAGAIQPRCVGFALQPLLRKLERELAPEAEGRGLVYRLRDTALQVWADPELVELILRNFINNAIRYTERGGVLVAVRHRQGSAVLEVWDTGIGIPAAQQLRVFDAFHQVGNPERDRRKGLGLGLAIVNGLAEALGTEATLASVPGRGSVFRLRLPLAQAAQAVAPPVVSSPGPVRASWLAGRAVLVLDDDPVNGLAMMALIRSWQAECRACETLEEALQRVAEGYQPDLLIVDYRLRDHTNGYQAIDAISVALGHRPGALVVTGDTAPERIREGLASGVPLLHKPVGESALCQALELLSRDNERLAPIS
ncbi:hybrid sensor histidine kinase/response regulator [Pseudomonas sp. 9Ag]|uniref:hybrid sensor histidine kinase/response regulator n=1 Tax=Pseudomonas sp. 9Ag TaxID=2653167 RepID=UPI0012F1D51F|nr:hybrid sensor histidine kinase/response regulator [Pseudomonas sp. 9Ag]VXD03330.1 Hybrid sensor histidine kinase/response regulator [Pseudomonas sp. 9Ag]